MLSLVARKTASTLATRQVGGAASIAVRNFGIADQLQSKKKVEEDRFIRENEKKFFENKKKELEAKLHEEELAVFQETIAPAMADAEHLLEKTGDKVSENGLEALARWKLDMEEE